MEVRMGQLIEVVRVVIKDGPKTITKYFHKDGRYIAEVEYTTKEAAKPEVESG